jgi:hypothetical protein
MRETRDHAVQQHIVKHPLILAAILGLASHASAQITLDCDYTSAGARGEPIHDHWNVSNRISPMRSFAMPVGENPRINIVRPLGGKSKNGKMLVEEDTYKWDGHEVCLRLGTPSINKSRSSGSGPRSIN